ncbi:MAG: D-alanine--D-alanine ligase [Planctomycetes bacterium]|nr:D-alanine--D-alanine ligase [Planctomycetota bacterium]
MTVEPSANSQLSPAETPLKIAVLAGGIGTECDISIQSGTCIAQALKDAGLNVVLSDITPDNLDILKDKTIDVFFIALHGKFGEDGWLQQILEDKSLLYTGSNPAASRLAMDKMASKKAFAQAGIDTPAAIEFDSQTDIPQLERQLQQFTNKFVVKPIKEGSSVGISIVTNINEAIAIAQKCLEEFGDCMIEEFIPGREITVGILCDKALPIVEIKTESSFYDYQAKYLDKKTEYLFDTIDNSVLATKIRTAAIDCFNALDCQDFARVDFILGDDKKIHALEVNTIPGFTTHSLLPKAAARIGLSMSDLCLKIIKAAIQATKNIRIIETTVKSKKTKSLIIDKSISG